MGLLRLPASLILLSLLTIANSHLATDGATKLAMVTEVHSALSKRELSPLPNYLHVQFDVDGSPVNLRLVRNSNININAPVTFEGEKTEKRNNIAMVTDSDVYQDITNMAAISITAGSDEKGATKRTLEGSFIVNGKRYGIKPAPIRLSKLKRVLEKRLLHREAKGHLHEIQELTAVRRSMEGDYVIMKNVDRHRKLNKPDRRRKRAVEGSIAAYNVELTMALDHTIWEKYMQENSDKDSAMKALRYDYGHQVNGMDLAYRLIDAENTGFSISVFLSKYHIAKTFTTSHWTTDAIKTRVTGDYTNTLIDGIAALNKIGEWAVTGGRTWKNTDHVMLWTRYDVRTYSEPPGNPIGIAPVAAICDPGQSVSLVEFTGFHSWSTAAHELGHNFGSGHDDNSTGQCSSNSNYIMTAVAGSIDKEQIKNAFMFSPCSIAQFKATLSGKDAHLRGQHYIAWPRVCLTNRVCDHDEPVDLDQLPGAKYSLDEQCALNFGDGHTFHEKAGVDVCYRLLCNIPTKPNYYTFRPPGAARGTPCGSNKECCFQGRCVSDCSNPPVSTDATCRGTGLPTDVPKGCTDTHGASYCDEIVLTRPYDCFHENTRTGCCAACHRAGLVTPTQHVIVPTESTTTKATTSTGTTTATTIMATPSTPTTATTITGTPSTPTTATTITTTPSTTTIGATTTFTPTTPTTTDTVPCLDIGKSSCQDFGFGPSDCAQQWFRNWCRKTCGCVCEDYVTYCDQYSYDCHNSAYANFFRTNCMMTCGFCASNGLPPAVDGGWGEWSAWGECSTSCGPGVAHRQRLCDSPHPSNGGEPCTGHDSEQGSCELASCSNNGCADRSSRCGRYKRLCRATNRRAMFVRRKCPNTCDICGCVDEYPSWCRRYAKYCNRPGGKADKFRAYCPLTCDTC